MITGPARYKPNIWWATLTGHFSNNIKVIIAQMGAAAEMFAAQLYRERRRYQAASVIFSLVTEQINEEADFRS